MTPANEIPTHIGMSYEEQAWSKLSTIDPHAWGALRRISMEISEFLLQALEDDEL